MVAETEGTLYDIIDFQKLLRINEIILFHMK